jgi:hypothetical protein
VQVFLSHTTTDKDIVEPIGSFLASRGLTVWLDSWRMTAGDSLIQKIGEGIEASDRLVVDLAREDPLHLRGRCRHYGHTTGNGHLRRCALGSERPVHVAQ